MDSKPKIPHPQKPRFRDCKDEKEYRRRKAAYRKALHEYHFAERASREAALSAELSAQAEARKNETLANKLFGWGHRSSTNPAGEWGVVPQVLTVLIGLPILGLLYKLSFGVLAPFLTAVIVLVVAPRSRNKRDVCFMLLWSIGFAVATLTGYPKVALLIFFSPFAAGLAQQLF